MTILVGLAIGFGGAALLGYALALLTEANVPEPTPPPDGLTECADDGCGERFEIGPDRCCEACGFYFCPAHLHYRTWYGGGPIMVCSDCLAEHADPIEH